MTLQERILEAHERGDTAELRKLQDEYRRNRDRFSAPGFDVHYSLERGHWQERSLGGGRVERTWIPDCVPGDQRRGLPAATHKRGIVRPQRVPRGAPAGGGAPRSSSASYPRSQFRIRFRTVCESPARRPGVRCLLLYLETAAIASPFVKCISA